MTNITMSSSEIQSFEEMRTIQLGEGAKITQLGDRNVMFQEEKVSSGDEWISKDTEN